MLNAPSFPLRAAWYFLWPRRPSLEALCPWVGGMWGGKGGNFCRAKVRSSTPDPARASSCFHAPCSTVAARARGLACLLGAWTVSAALVLLSVACPHPGCPGDCPGPWSPITGECPRRVWDQVWARRAPGCGCFGSLRDCGEADITLPSPRENSWGMTLPFAVTAPPPGCVLGTVGAAGPAGCGPG